MKGIGHLKAIFRESIAKLLYFIVVVILEKLKIVTVEENALAFNILITTYAKFGDPQPWLNT